MFFTWRPWSEWLVVYDSFGRVVARRVSLALVRLAPWLSVDTVIRLGTVHQPPGSDKIVFDHSFFVGPHSVRRVISSAEVQVHKAPPTAQGPGMMQMRRGNIIGAFFNGCPRDVSEMLNSVDGSVTRAQLASVAAGNGIVGALASDGLAVTYSDLSEVEYIDPDSLIAPPGRTHQHID